MKRFQLLILLFLPIHCVSLDQPDYQTVVPSLKDNRKEGRLLGEFREIAEASSNLSKENFKFIPKKLKSAMDRYNILKIR